MKANRNKPRLAWISFFAATFGAIACSGVPEVPTATPNIILVTVDTLRADHLEVYGYDRATAPSIARLASQGVRFSRALSQAPWTLPSMASVHSSLYPIQHGAFAAETALPEAARDPGRTAGEAVGYRTVAVVSHEFVAAKHGFGQGFEVFDESNVLGHEAVTSRDSTMTSPWPQLQRGRRAPSSSGFTTSIPISPTCGIRRSASPTATRASCPTRSPRLIGLVEDERQPMDGCRSQHFVRLRCTTRRSLTPTGGSEPSSEGIN